MAKGAQRTKRTQTGFLALLVLAAVSGTVRDAISLRESVSGVGDWAVSWLRAGSTVYASALSPAESCSAVQDQTENSADRFHWFGRIEPGQMVEIKGINGDISAEPAAGSDIDVTAIKKARHSDPASVNIEVVPNVSGVTICAVYPSESSDHPNRCHPGSSEGNSSTSTNVRHNDVSVNFSVRVPTGVEFVGRTINGEISATSLNGNVESHTVNGGIHISTAGYARAKTVNGDIAAKLGNPNWPDALEFKTLNGGITLDLPAALSTRVDANTLNGEISSDFPLSVLGRMSRKHLNGTIGAGGRQLVLKTLNGSIRLRRVG